MLISVLIMAVITVGAGILLFSTPVEAEAQDPPEEEPVITTPEDDLSSVQGLLPEPTPIFEEPEPEEPAMTLEVTSIQITYGGNVLTDFTERKGVPIELGVRIEPPGVDVEIEWESTNEEVFEFVNVVGGVRVVGIENGDAQLIVRAGDKEASTWVRIR